MPIPLNTTQITVSRYPDLAKDIDEYEVSPSPANVIVTDVRAVISLPSGSNKLVGGDRIVYNARMTCDTCDLQPMDVVEDQTTGDTWRCMWVRPYGQFGLDHMVAQLRQVIGASA
ncbi:MAG: hypothetical protein KGR26_13640 [Cyanobacteria bacterium REEB65]|nr:hypothetical protein [Cyanobacteria bacterium REEB65]